MSRVKEGLRTVLGKLRPDDVVSIVGFDASAQVMFPASRLGNGEGVRNAIECLIPGGSTNIHRGLMVQVKIEYGPGLRLDKIFGYSPRHSHGSVSVTLDDMNNGLTQVVMARFRTDSIRGPLPVKVRLSYYDVRRKCTVEEVQDLRLVPAESDSCALLVDVEVKKNYTIAELADSLFEMAGLARRGNYLQAQNTLDASVATAYRRYPNMEDEDIRFILEIVESYRRDLKVFNAHSRSSDCGGCR